MSVKPTDTDIWPVLLEMVGRVYPTIALKTGTCATLTVQQTIQLCS
jgi:hypothetical protein